jgi:hypothetical protein
MNKNSVYKQTERETYTVNRRNRYRLVENKEAVIKAAEKIVGYKKCKNRKWLRTWMTK